MKWVASDCIVAVLLGALLRFVQNSMLHSSVVSISPFLCAFCYHLCGASI